MDDVRKEDAKCAGKPEGLAGLLAWLKKVGIPLPLALVTPEALANGTAKKMIEAKLGYPVTLVSLDTVQLVSLGTVKIMPCNCKLFRMRRNALWN
jgi:hypothetical protein